MKVILNDPINPVRAMVLYTHFLNDFPPDHKQCAYNDIGVSRDLMTYIKRTKAGNIVINQWHGERKNGQKTARRIAGTG